MGGPGREYRESPKTGGADRNAQRNQASHAKGRTSRWILLVMIGVWWLPGWGATRATSADSEPAARVSCFDAARLEALRREANAVAQLARNTLEGWSKSRIDLSDLLRAFQPLSVKPGVVLRAYQFREGGNGRGIVWALPANSEFPEPDCCRLSRHDEQIEIDVPRPPAAFASIMAHIEGDGTPWSYLAASILSREISEFGARWHGREWSVHRILGTNPLTSLSENVDDPLAAPQGTAAEWHWLEPQPCRWEPHVCVDQERVTVTFYTYSGWERQRIYRHTDRYTLGSYESESEQTEIAVGPGGFLF